MPDTLIFDNSGRLRMRVTGPKALEMVNGLVTNDVVLLKPGEGLYAVALTAKSKIVADLKIFRETDSVLIDASARAGAGWMDMVRKYINPRMAPYKDVSSEIGDIGVYGPSAASIIEKITGTSAPAKPYAHTDSNFGIVARIPGYGVDGFEIFAPTTPKDRIDDLKAALTESGARPGSHEDWELMRIKAGIPEWGIDMTDDTLPQEANMDELGAISYNKGCYIGQETVARIHFRGHVNKCLRKLVFTGGTVQVGAQLTDAEGKPVGEVRSALQGFGIGMVRREVEKGATLNAGPIEIQRA